MATEIRFACLALVLAACSSSPPPPPPPRQPICEPAVAGQLTEFAAQAKRLFDAEKWPEAANALARVAGGDSHDDLGTRQLAAYFYGIALYRSGKPAEAHAQFQQIIASPCHLKQREAQMWFDHPEAATVNGH